MPTLKDLAKSIYPKYEFKDWMNWPPDVFALFSIVFKKTGAFKYCLLEDMESPWYGNDWQEDVEKDHEIWLKYVCNQILEFKKNKRFPKNKYISEKIKIIGSKWDEFDIDKLRLISKLPTEDETQNNELKEFVASMIVLYVIADSSSAGLGLTGQYCKPEDRKFKLYQNVANLLLNNTGSLSTIPKFYGIVLPKMRTPQTGITIRSMTHHIGFHDTEVEVMWRTLPWINSSNQSLNILVVPHPKEIDITNFEVVNDKHHNVRYFRPAFDKFKKNNDSSETDVIINEDKEVVDSVFLEGLSKYVAFKAKTKDSIDIIVLPEVSLHKLQYTKILKDLKKEIESISISKTNSKNVAEISKYPIIVAGVYSEDTAKRSDNVEDYKNLPFRNEVRMAHFFAGKWYEIVQHKHHRWHLDKNQVLQYNLESYFPVDREWFEYCKVGQRRLSILAPNGWLALTSLICEDLAQQEPVGEIIRGIGPTLLMALLSDGPQLDTRWASRYASVLADDPGTAVLSLSSEGMVSRSQRLENPVENEKNDKDEKKIVGLWKDMVKSWKYLKLKPKNDGVLFTISAKFKEEFTLDGRTDGSCASVFEMSTVNPQSIEFPEIEKKGDVPFTDANDVSPISEDNKSESKQDKKLGAWNDIRDLSALIYTVDCVVELLLGFGSDQNKKDKPFEEQAVLKFIIKLLTESKNETNETDNNFIEIIQNKIKRSWKNPHLVGIEHYTIADEAHEEVKDAAQEVEEIIKPIKNKLSSFSDIISNIEERLKKIKEEKEDKNTIRIKAMVNLAILENIFLKLSTNELKGTGFNLKEAFRCRNKINVIKKDNLTWINDLTVQSYTDI